MSKICIGVICDLDLKLVDIVQALHPILNKSCLDISYKLTYDEPLIEEYDAQGCLILNISDRGTENCEMLLLPDDCLFNGKANNMRFDERMEHIKNVLAEVLELTPTVELFVGESGSRYDDFEEIEISLDRFSTLYGVLNSTAFPDLHIKVSTGDGSVC